MTTLATLVDQYGANAFIYCDKGNGSGFGEHGQTIDYDEDRAAAYGQIDLSPLNESVKSFDGAECSYASEWIAGDNGYSYRVMF